MPDNELGFKITKVVVLVVVAAIVAVVVVVLVAVVVVVVGVVVVAATVAVVVVVSVVLAVVVSVIAVMVIAVVLSAVATKPEVLFQRRQIYLFRFLAVVWHPQIVLWCDRGSTSHWRNFTVDWRTSHSSSNEEVRDHCCSVIFNNNQMCT